MKKQSLLFLLAIFLCCCSTADFSSTPTEQPGKEYCSESCDNLIKLDCAFGKLIIDDRFTIDCYQKCVNEHKEGYFWNTYCLIYIINCKEIDDYCKSIYKKY